MLRVYVNSNICYRSRFAKSTRQTMYKIPQFALRVESQRVVLCRSYLFLRPAVTASTPGHNGASEFPHPEFSDPQFISGVPLQTRTPPELTQNAPACPEEARGLTCRGGPGTVISFYCASD